jgi:hypothetical protein
MPSKNSQTLEIVSTFTQFIDEIKNMRLEGVDIEISTHKPQSLLAHKNQHKHATTIFIIYLFFSINFFLYVLSQAAAVFCFLKPF